MNLRHTIQRRTFHKSLAVCSAVSGAGFLTASVVFKHSYELGMAASIVSALGLVGAWATNEIYEKVYGNKIFEDWRSDVKKWMQIS